MFWILKSLNLVGNPSFCTILAYFLAASLEQKHQLLGYSEIIVSLPAVLFGLSTSADHLARAEYERSCPRLPVSKFGLRSIRFLLFKIQLEWQFILFQDAQT